MKRGHLSVGFTDHDRARVLFGQNRRRLTVTSVKGQICDVTVTVCQIRPIVIQSYLHTIGQSSRVYSLLGPNDGKCAYSGPRRCLSQEGVQQLNMSLGRHTKSAATADTFPLVSNAETRLSLRGGGHRSTSEGGRVSIDRTDRICFC